MPIYEYKCEACGHHLEEFQKMSDHPLTQCPLCQKTTLKKLISATSFQLKGTGWYATDFRDKGKPKKETSDEGGAEASSTKENAPESSSKEPSTKEAKETKPVSTEPTAKTNDKATE